MDFFPLKLLCFLLIKANCLYCLESVMTEFKSFTIYQLMIIIIMICVILMLQIIRIVDHLSNLSSFLLWGDCYIVIVVRFGGNSDNVSCGIVVLQVVTEGLSTQQSPESDRHGYMWPDRINFGWAQKFVGFTQKNHMGLNQVLVLTAEK